MESESARKILILRISYMLHCVNRCVNIFFLFSPKLSSCRQRQQQQQFTLQNEQTATCEKNARALKRTTSADEKYKIIENE